MLEWTLIIFLGFLLGAYVLYLQMKSRVDAALSGYRWIGGLAYGLMLIAFGAFSGYLFWTGQATAWPEGVVCDILGWGFVVIFVASGLWVATYSILTNRLPGRLGEGQSDT